MPLDHFVSQVHLKNFYSNKGVLTGVKKIDLETFPAKSNDVCRREDGNTNDFLLEPRAIEEFLKTIEPNYNIAVTNLRNQNINVDTVYVLSGFVAYILTCSPTAIRLMSEIPKAMVEASIPIIEQNVDLPELPSPLDNSSLSKAIDEGEIVVDIDENYTQSIGISSILRTTNMLGNCHWEILISTDESAKFITSDYPIVAGESYDPRVVSRTVPLATNIAIRIHPRIDKKSYNEFDFPNFHPKYVNSASKDVRNINRNIIRAAERMVFFSEAKDWNKKFVNNNKNFRTETVVTKILMPQGQMVLFKNEIRSFLSASE